MESPHMIALQAKHADLEARISEESRRPATDDFLVARLKKEKLALKQEIGRS